MNTEALASRRQQTVDTWGEIVPPFPSAHRLNDLCTNSQVRIGAARTEDQYKSASRLVQRMYNWRGYDSPALGRNSNEITLVAYQDNEVVATLTLGLDSSAGLAVDQHYKAEADRLRGKGHRLCDVTRLAVDPDIKSKRVLGALFHLSVIYGRNIHRATDLLIEVNPRHALFYQRMIGFVPSGGEKFCQRVNAPAVLLKLDLGYSDEQVKQYGGLGTSAQGVRSMYPYWFSKEDELRVTGRLKWGQQ